MNKKNSKEQKQKQKEQKNELKKVQQSIKVNSLNAKQKTYLHELNEYIYVLIYNKHKTT